MRKSVTFTLATFAALCLSGAICFAGKGEVYAGHLTKKAFDRMETRLKQLQPGTPLEDSGIEWSFWAIKEGFKTTGAIATADGWVGFLSGGVYGAEGIGHLRGVSEESLQGIHVFGYLWRKMTLVPRYRVMTTARRISETEFDGIDPRVLGARGKVESAGEVFFYRDVTIEDVRELRFADPEVAGTRQEKLSRRGFKKFLYSLASQESFSTVSAKIDTSVKPGCKLLDAVAELGGIYTTLNSGKDYYLFLDGYLRPWMGKADDYPLVSIGAGGRYEVWPFGYLDNKEPKPQVALVFRNGELETILRDASKAAVAVFLEERSRPSEPPEKPATAEAGTR